MIDGPVLVADALAAGIDLQAIYVELDDGGRVPDAIAAVADRAPAGVVRHLLAPGVLAGAVDAVTPNGIAAIAPITAVTIGEVAGAPGAGPVLVLAGVGDPGNAGTLVRSAEAAGARGVITLPGTVDLFSPKAVRASAGSVLRLPVAGGADAATVVEVLRGAGARLLGLDMAGAVAYDQADLRPALAVVVGGEAHGLDPSLAAAVDEVVAIPMLGGVESLNVAMAGTLVLFEAARQRRTSSR